MVDGYSKGEIFVKKVNKKTSGQNKAYSSKNSKYVQQAQKLFDDNEKNVETNNQAKKNGNISVLAVKKQSGTQARKNPTSTNKKKIVQGRPSVQSKNTKLSNVKAEDTIKQVKTDTEVSIKEHDKINNEKKVVADKTKIKEAITKIEYEKAQAAAKKKTLELVEELKQKNNIKTDSKSSTKNVKKITNVTKNPQEVKQEPNSSHNNDQQNKEKLRHNVNEEVVNPKEKDIDNELKVNEPREDELLLKLQEELNKKDKEIISSIDLTEDENLNFKIEDNKEEKPAIKKVDDELKKLIEKEENQEKEEKNITVSKVNKIEKKESIKEVSPSKKDKKKKVKKPVSKFGKVLSAIAFLGFVFFIVTSVIVINRVCAIGIIPNKYIYMGSGILGVFALLMLLFNITKSKILHVMQILLTGVLGAVFIYISIFLTNVNNSLKAVFTSEENIVLYYVAVPDTSTYSSINDLKDKKVGLLRHNLTSVQECLKDYNFTYQAEYNVAMLNELLNSEDSSKKVEAIIIEQSVYDLLEELDNKFYKSLKIIYEFDAVNNIVVEEEDPNMEIVPGEDEQPVESTAPKRNPDLLKGVDIGNSFIVYINGVDGRGNSKPYGLSDVNMLVVVNPDTHKVLLVSVPRDYFVRVPGTTPGMRDKLTHSGLYGINTSIGAMEGIFGVNINDYLQFGFGAVPIVVDSVGGVDVYSDTEFESSHMRGWHVPKGWVHMDGAQALAYARERYAYINLGDKHRVKNQQDIVQAIIKKCVTDPQQLMKFDQILNGINPYFNTNISYERMQEMVKQQLNSLTPWSVEKISVDGYGGTQVTASYPTSPAYVMYPYEYTIVNAQEKILEVMTGK